jgi:hypothetical protein
MLAHLEPRGASGDSEEQMAGGGEMNRPHFPVVPTRPRTRRSLRSMLSSRVADGRPGRRRRGRSPPIFSLEVAPRALGFPAEQMAGIRVAGARLARTFRFAARAALRSSQGSSSAAATKTRLPLRTTRSSGRTCSPRKSIEQPRASAASDLESASLACASFLENSLPTSATVAALPQTLRTIIAAHVERTGHRGDELLFGRTPHAPFTPSFVQDKADDAWAELERVTLHECRHSYSTYLDAAGVSDTRADRYMGHANPSVANRYRHQLEGQLAEDAARLDEYLSGAVVGKVIPLLTGAHTGAQREEIAQ